MNSVYDKNNYISKLNTTESFFTLSSPSHSRIKGKACTRQIYIQARLNFKFIVYENFDKN